MKKLIASLMLLAMLCGLTAPTFAEEAASSPAATETVAASAVAAAPAVAEVPNKGDTSWMIVATLLVIMMSIPGLALFYGGLVRSKNMLSVLMQVFSIFALITV